MKNKNTPESTGQYEQGRRRKRLIHVGDLVSLGVPRKESFLAFEVLKEVDGFVLIYHSGDLSEGSPHYKQALRSQVHKIIGNTNTGIDESLLI